LIASVGYFPELYGEALIKLSFDLLAKRQTPPAVFIRHHLMTAENVDHFYPNDALLGFVSAPREPAPPPLARVSPS
jgi:ribose transport system substrate-binding protein